MGMSPKFRRNSVASTLSQQHRHHAGAPVQKDTKMAQNTCTRALQTRKTVWRQLQVFPHVADNGAMREHSNVARSCNYLGGCVWSLVYRGLGFISLLKYSPAYGRSGL